MIFKQHGSTGSKINTKVKHTHTHKSELKLNSKVNKMEQLT